MSKIDWSKAPEWADGHGLVAHHGITEVWINMDQYAVVGAEDRAYPYGGGTGDNRHNFTRSQVQYITPRPARWDGEGLPPVGSVCEAYDAERDLWWPGQVLMHGNSDHAFVSGTPECWGTLLWASIFRPVRTPEQIKAEEREKAIVEMAETMHAATGFGVNRADCEALYDAGYRKQVESCQA
ncbi:hypothetical protein [Pseudomonas sp.]|uniref:hypothetical protein n=1 Tax=Pseudomonas sp. TaxID=306 RepID=UPI002648A80B|nr:hypothetical protein [Pseudomonas sp.]MDN5518947.1 hypothetical protein [Pseudomonas sp.]MDN5530980.1 hypothetical protein [Pseudomonas sp.]